jgi:hypothetical protein
MRRMLVVPIRKAVRRAPLRLGTRSNSLTLEYVQRNHWQ